MYIFILLILNYFIYQYLYVNYYKNAEHLNEYPKIKQILNNLFMDIKTIIK